MTLGWGDHFFALFNFLSKKNLKKKQSKKLNFLGGGGLFWLLLLKKVKKTHVKYIQSYSDSEFSELINLDVKKNIFYTKTNVFSIVIFWINMK
jgi:hypothetical protein